VTAPVTEAGWLAQTKTYLGDGAYAAFDGFAIHLTAENGITATDRVVLEPEVFNALLRFVDGLKRRAP
jgi:hypothetical protein